MSSRDRSFCAFVHHHPQRLAQHLEPVAGCPTLVHSWLPGIGWVSPYRIPMGPCHGAHPRKWSWFRRCCFSWPGLCVPGNLDLRGWVMWGWPQETPAGEDVSEGRAGTNKVVSSRITGLGSESGDVPLRSCSPRAREPPTAHQGCSPSRHCCPAGSGAVALPPRSLLPLLNSPRPLPCRCHPRRPLLP